MNLILLLCADVEACATSQYVKYFRRVTLPEIAENCKNSCKPCTVGELQPHARTMKTTAHAAPLYAMQTEIAFLGFKELVVEYITAYSRQ